MKPAFPRAILLRRLPFLLLGLLWLAPLLAAESWYEVEVVVFAHTQPDGSGEHWPVAEAYAPEWNSAFPLPGRDASSGSGEARLMHLPAEQYRLATEARRLGNSANYRVLLHAGWRQAGLPREQAIAVRLTDAAMQLDGTLRLLLSRYLHLEADLIYRPLDGAQAVYRLRESRRMRSREIHYLDHPMFGIIALVTPYEPPAVPAAVPAPAIPPPPAQ